MRTQAGGLLKFALIFLIVPIHLILAQDTNPPPSQVWTTPKDVFALTGDAPGGTVTLIAPSVGSCPPFGAVDRNAELVLALWFPEIGPKVLVMNHTHQLGWSPWRQVPNGAFNPAPIGVDPLLILTDVRVSARPFSDTAKPR